MPDKCTLYFASNGQNSTNDIGAYNINDKILSEEIVISTDFHQIRDTIQYTKDDNRRIGMITNFSFENSVRAPTYEN